MEDITKKCSRFSVVIIFQLIVIIIWNFVNMYLEKTNDNIDNKQLYDIHVGSSSN